MLKSYSVKEIAEMLKTNPETVRRWIRNGKLSAVISSKKHGSVVYESELNKFLDSAPKYAKIVEFAPALGIPAVVLGLAGGIFASYVDSKRINDARISPDETIRYIKSEIKIRETNIKKKQKEIEALQEDIRAEEQQIEQLEHLINHTDR
jgi:excisionase family DNA binding protein